MRTRRQSELFDQLVVLVLADGFATLTLDDVARRFRCSKATLYSLAGSREQLVRATVVHFFRAAAERVEARLLAQPDVQGYLLAVADELRPASGAFFDDVANLGVAREVYERNTRFAAARVRELIAEGVADGRYRDVDPGFVADVVASTMVRIQQRQVASSTGMSDADAYAALADLVSQSLAVRTGS